MIRHLLRFRRAAAVAAAAAAIAVLTPAPALAHEARVGDITIVHPFATPSLPGTSTGAAYVTTLENSGARADRLLRASTPAAARVELHTMSVDAQGVMRMREIDGIVLAPKASVTMRPGMGLHLMLVGLKEPLREGTSFPMTLEFEHAGKVEVQVVVQKPKAQDAPAEMHMH